MHRLLLLLASATALGATPAVAESATFESPPAAVAALVEALETLDAAAIAALFGPGNEDLVLSGDAQDDRAAAADFLSAHAQAHDLSAGSDGRHVLSVGVEAWPFPVPIVPADDGRWRFDAEAGREELRLRTIGGNELEVIGLMRAYVEVQAAYRQVDFDGDGVMEYADAILSDPGARNGLYWPGGGTGSESPVAEPLARASDGGFRVGEELLPPEPHAGYLFRILTRQGEAAPGGAYDYRVNGNMVAGHALLAFPAVYGQSGIMSFVVGESGIVYEADLGEDTAARASAIEAFEPAEPWSRAGE